MKKVKYSKIIDIIKEAKKGKMFILVDDENRENEGDLIIPASKVSASSIPKEFSFEYFPVKVLISKTSTTIIPANK